MQPPAASNVPHAASDFVPNSDRAASADTRLRSRRPTNVALIGASVRAAAQSARFGGFQVTGLDCFGDDDTLAACRRHLLLDKDQLVTGNLQSELWQSIARIGEAMPIIPVGGLSGSQNWFDRLPLMKPWPEQRQASKQVRNLHYLHQITAGTPFAIPPTLPASERPDTGACGFDSRRWLQKDRDCSGGLGTRWIDDANPRLSSAVWQKWVEGQVQGATMLGNGSEAVLLGVCRSRFTRKGPFPFVHCGSVGPVSCAPQLRHGLEELGQRITTTCGLRGLFNLDVVIERSGSCWLLEINPRWSGSSELIERHLQRGQGDLSLMSLAIDSLDGLAISPDLKDAAHQVDTDRIYHKRIVFARRPLRFLQDPILQELRQNETLHDTPANGQLIARGEPVCTIITELRGYDQAAMRRHRALVKQLSGAC